MSSQNKRRYDRRHSIYYLRVYDRITNTLLGNLVDISERGVMLISDRRIEIDKPFQLSMQLPEAINGTNTIEFDAASRWCRNDSNRNFWDTGFELIDPNTDFLLVLEQLIEGYSFRGY